MLVWEDVKTVLCLRGREKPGAISKAKAMQSSAKISVVDASGRKAAVTLHRGAGMSPVKKQGARAL